MDELDELEVGVVGVVEVQESPLDQEWELVWVWCDTDGVDSGKVFHVVEIDLEKMVSYFL